MRTKTGKVSSTKMPKTVTITVHTYKRHSKYKKSYRTTKKFHAHDENEVCKEGDIVVIEEHRPISKLKHWKVITVNDQDIASVKASPAAEPAPESVPEVAAPAEDVVPPTEEPVISE